MRLGDIGQLQYARNLAASDRWEEAADVVAELLERHPDSIPALELMLQISSELEDPTAMWFAAWKLVKLSPDDQNAYFALAAASMANALPFCALYFAQDYLRRWPKGNNADDLAELKETVEPLCAKIQADDPAAVGKPVDDLALVDQSHFLVSNGFYEEGREVCQQAIERLPDIPAPRNNLALAYSIEGNLKEALRIPRQTVEQFPDNLHARCNLIELLVRSGSRDEAETLADGLRQTADARFDDWVKLMEAFTYLGDDQAVVNLYLRFQKTLDKGDFTPPMTKHLAAVALARSGNEKQARKLWKEALHDDPTMHIAQDNLDDLQNRPGERSGAWPFPLPQWIPVTWVKSLLDIAEVSSEGAMKRSMERFVRETPEFLAVTPILLERGDPYSREFVLHTASYIPVPGLREFVLSSHGTDEDRMEASRYATEQGLLPRGKPVLMYNRGKQQELMLMNYEIHDEPQRADMPKQARRLMEQSVAAMRQGNIEEALRLAQEGLKIAPDAPPLMNGVAAALAGLGRREELEVVVRRTAELHPNYLFGRCDMARLCIEEGKLDEAQQWLEPLLERPRLHFSEFNAICMAQIELLTAKGETDGARSWLAIWEQANPDALQIPIYRQKLKKR
jgi:tetratricopeptide (TPR) repeat protein